ncbi:hypothetical protein JHK82_012065 [Glycine max]|nr:hypothetical protein JHK82_012065 [Glycine max]
MSNNIILWWYIGTNNIYLSQPINAIKDADILERLWKDFEDQLWCDLYDDVAHMQTLRKRGRKTTSKVLFQVPFSFQPPEFCLKENINLEIVIEFLLDVEIPRKGGSKKAKVVGAVDNQVSGSASHESSRRKEMSFTSQIVNKMKSSDEKGTNELDNKVMSDELKNKMKDLEKEIMPWDDDEMGLYKMGFVKPLHYEHILRYQHANNGEVGKW